MRLTNWYKDALRHLGGLRGRQELPVVTERTPSSLPPLESLATDTPANPPRRVAMNYLVRVATPQGYADFVKKIEGAKALLEGKYPDIEYKHFQNKSKPTSYPNYPGYGVRITEKKAGGLDESVLREVFKLLGQPNFVHDGSDYDLVDDALTKELGIGLAKPNTWGARVTVLSAYELAARRANYAGPSEQQSTGFLRRISDYARRTVR
ncbi:hypothetical protein HYY71_04575 [Candidatus Woesearchaeota archaeon]|nr:hypothetical protein [Candidatus Woesearchaeota archaeon]